MIYEYYCDKCKKKFEKYIKNDEANHSDNAYCPYCNSISRKIISKINFNMGYWKEKQRKEIEYAKEPVKDAKIIDN